MRQSDCHFKCATQVLTLGGVIAYPTEAVWGLGCDPWNESAVIKILEIKQRPMHKGLILVASHWSQFEPLMDGLSAPQIKQLTLSWPGPTTWLIPDPKGWVPQWIKGRHLSVALRVSAHPLVLALCDEFNGPIVSTSANLAGCEPARSQLEVTQTFSGQLDYVLSGELGESKQPSQVKDLVSGQVIRPA
jgi:L-threonylcarbamoyladenylate synthase